MAGFDSLQKTQIRDHHLFGGVKRAKISLKLLVGKWRGRFK
jgi:hypothetical protein